MKYSIVIPTRSRAHLLGHALASALGQDFDDFEVVVSDNCSTDATPQVIAAAAHARLRAVRPERSLSMVDHWEFALNQARGEWVLFLCDDDALMPNALRVTEALLREHQELELVQYGELTFVYDDGIVQAGNYVDVARELVVSGHFASSHGRLRHNFRRMKANNMPKFLNAAVNRSLIERVLRAHGRMFLDWAPDYSSGSLLLAHSERFAYIGPLRLWGENLLSYGSGSSRSPAHLLSFFEQFDSFSGKLPFSPYPELLTIASLVYDTLCRAREALGPRWAGLEIDPVAFHRQLLADVERYASQGHEGYAEIATQVRERLRQLRTARALQPLARVRGLAAGAPFFAERLQQSVKKRLKARPPLERQHYANIAEAARALGSASVLPATSKGWTTVHT